MPFGMGVAGRFAAALLTLMLGLPAAGGAEADPSPTAPPDWADLEKIDTHVHLYGALPAFIAQAQADGFRVLTINVNYADFPPLATQFDDARALVRANPERVAFAATFDASGSDAPGWRARAQAEIHRALDGGAVAIKLWKDIGLQWRDPDGRAVMIDDPRFAPLLDDLAQRGVVVLGHQGEPRNAWLPLEAMTIRGDRDYFAEHPQYHMALHPECPNHEAQIAARDRMLDQHPDLRFVGVHLASLEWDVARIADFLRRYPQASVDLAARLVHLQLQARDDRAAVRQFFIEFQDRIFYGTDLTREDGQRDAAFAAEADRVWRSDWAFLAGSDEGRSEDFDGTFRGLALPRPVLRKIYADNARRLFPQAWPSGQVAQP